MTSREQKIKEQALEIMNNFYQSLSKAKISSDEIGVKRAIQTREAKQTAANEEFKQKILANAPKKDIDHIIAERKTW